MGLADNALTDLATAKVYLKVTGTADDAVIEGLINRASDLCESWCNRSFKARVLTNLRMAGVGSRCLLLRSVPLDISEPVILTVDGTAQTVWRSEADGADPSLFDVMVASFEPEGLAGPDHLYREQGWWPTNGNPYNVLLTYTGGYETIPDDLQQAALYVAQKLYRDQQKQLAEVVSVTTAAGGITLLDNHIPRMAQALLAPYRLRQVA